MYCGYCCRWQLCKTILLPSLRCWGNKLRCACIFLRDTAVSACSILCVNGHVGLNIVAWASRDLLVGYHIQNARNSFTSEHLLVLAHCGVAHTQLTKCDNLLCCCSLESEACLSVSGKLFKVISYFYLSSPSLGFPVPEQENKPLHATVNFLTHLIVSVT